MVVYFYAEAGHFCEGTASIASPPALRVLPLGALACPARQRKSCRRRVVRYGKIIRRVIAKVKAFRTQTAYNSVATVSSAERTIMRTLPRQYLALSSMLPHSPATWQTAGRSRPSSLTCPRSRRPRRAPRIAPVVSLNAGVCAGVQCQPCASLAPASMPAMYASLYAVGSHGSGSTRRQLQRRLRAVRLSWPQSTWPAS